MLHTRTHESARLTPGLCQRPLRAGRPIIVRTSPKRCYRGGGGCSSGREPAARIGQFQDSVPRCAHLHNYGASGSPGGLDLSKATKACRDSAESTSTPTSAPTSTGTASRASVDGTGRRRGPP